MREEKVSWSLANKLFLKKLVKTMHSKNSLGLDKFRPKSGGLSLERHTIFGTKLVSILVEILCNPKIYYYCTTKK